MATKVLYGRQLKPHFFRAWRDYRKLSLEQVAEALGTSGATISRYERLLQPYSQEVLEALAELYRTDEVSLLTVDPTAPPKPESDEEPILEVWREAEGRERRQILDAAKSIIRHRE